MKALGKWSVVSLIRFIVEFAWAVVLGAIVICSATLLIGFFTGSGYLLIGFPVYLQAGEFISEMQDIFKSSSIIMHPSPRLSTTYISFESLSTSALLALSQIGFLGFTLYGLTVLKRPLNALVQENVFEPENSGDLKTLSLLLLLAAPLKFGYEWLSKWNFESINGTTEISTIMPPFDFTLLAAGLICYIIAEIVSKAAMIYEEQKLTV